jgi:hypothetical protein
MIKLLMSYENPTVTIYKSSEENRKVNYKEISIEEIMLRAIVCEEDRKDNCREQTQRDIIIRNIFYHENIDAIELLLTLKLMSANRGLHEITYRPKINEKILNLILKNGPTNIKDILIALKEKNSPESEQNIKLLERVCNIENMNF